MKKNIFIIIAFLSALATTPTPSFAAFCMSCGQDECTSTLDFTNPTYCTKQASTCLKDTCIKWCTECSSGYKLEQHIAQVEGCDNSPTVYSCVKESSGGGTDPGEDCDGTCDGCSAFPRPSPYENISTDPGYAMSTTSTCNTQTCNCENKTSFSCADGYYGTASCDLFALVGSSRNCTGCTKCPTLGGADAFTQWFSFGAPGGSSITDCFIKSGTEIKDSIGTYVFESKCNYKQ